MAPTSHHEMLANEKKRAGGLSGHGKQLSERYLCTYVRAYRETSAALARSRSSFDL